MLTLGINGGFRPGYQDISAALLNDGEIIAAVEEERLSRIKSSPMTPPIRAIKEVLAITNTNIRNINSIATHGISWKGDFEKRFSNFIKFHFGVQLPVRLYDHHTCHAASTYYGSGFEEAIILTLDCSGDGYSTKVFLGNNGEITEIESYARPNSLGLFYSLITQYLGFSRDNDEYKVMGLAPYGTDRFDLSFLLQKTKSFYKFDSNYLKSFDSSASQPIKYEQMYIDDLEEILAIKPRLNTEPITQIYKDLAASAQKAIEKVVINKIVKLIDKYNINNLCLAGGVSLNTKMLGEIAKIDNLSNFYTPFCSGDNGIAIGASILEQKSHNIQIKPFNTPYLGTSWSDEQIRSALEQFQIEYHQLSDIVGSAKKILLQGHILAWFQGKMEFGHRSLGNRSILALPNKKDVIDLVNYKIKFRESFRPFAPSIPEEESNKYFETNNVKSPYMNIVFKAKQKTKELAPAIVHIDNTSRVHTVKKDTNPLYWRLLMSLQEKGYPPILLNTSFNRSNEPIVCSPRDAISCFYGSGIDSLIIGSFLVTKKNSQIQKNPHE